MGTRYYTPSIEEFHVGFEVEIKNSASAIDRWNKVVVCKDFLPTLFKINLDTTRVKYLDKQDLEELGFEITTEEYKDYGTYFNGRIKESNWGYTDLWYAFLTNKDSILITLKSSHFNGNFRARIKNKSELKRLLKQIEL